MNGTNLDIEILHTNVSACAERIGSLVYSISKNKPQFPLTLQILESLSEDQKESVDALILRYSQCVSMIQDQIFRGIALAEQEDLSSKSNRDKALLMEKLGVIVSADHFGSAAVLRNKFSHHYPEESQEQLDKLNLLIEEAEFVVEVFDHIVEFSTQKGFLPKGNTWGGKLKILARSSYSPK